MILTNISLDCVIFGFIKRSLNVLLWQAEKELLLKIMKGMEKFDQIRILKTVHLMDAREKNVAQLAVRFYPFEPSTYEN
jgi:hypothetical protein